MLKHCTMKTYEGAGLVKLKELLRQRKLGRRVEIYSPQKEPFTQMIKLWASQRLFGCCRER
jgi:hypothetical protein